MCDVRVNPIYTVKEGSVFIVDVMKAEFLQSEGLRFIVKDYDTVGRNDELGHVQVPPKTLIGANGDRMVFPLSPPKGSKYKEAGVLNLRCRLASKYDRKFLDYLSSQKGDFMGIDRNTNIVMKPLGGSRALLKEKSSAAEKTGKDAGIKKVRSFSAD